MLAPTAFLLDGAEQKVSKTEILGFYMRTVCVHVEGTVVPNV